MCASVLAPVREVGKNPGCAPKHMRHRRLSVVCLRIDSVSAIHQLFFFLKKKKYLLTPRIVFEKNPESGKWTSLCSPFSSRIALLVDSRASGSREESRRLRQ